MVLANTAVAIGIGVFLGFAVATQVFPQTPDSTDNQTIPGPVHRLDFAAGIASGAPAGEAIFVKTSTGAALFDFDGQVLARYEGFVATFGWLADGSGVLMRSPEGEARGDAFTTLPVVVLELDGKVTRLPLDAPDAVVASARLSPDGKWIAFATDRVYVADREGGELRPLTDPTAPLTLLGWDAKGRVVTRDADGLALLTVDRQRERIELPAALRGTVLSRLAGGDPGAVVLGAEGALWRLAGTTVEPIAPECVPFWVAPRELLCLTGASAGAFDVQSGARRALSATVDDAVRAGMRASSGAVLLWIDRSNAVRALDLSTGIDRVMQGAPANARFEPLEDERFLANDRHDTYLVEPRAP